MILGKIIGILVLNYATIKPLTIEVSECINCLIQLRHANLYMDRYYRSNVPIEIHNSKLYISSPASISFNMYNVSIYNSDITSTNNNVIINLIFKQGRKLNFTGKINTYYKEYKPTSTRSTTLTRSKTRKTYTSSRSATHTPTLSMSRTLTQSISRTLTLSVSRTLTQSISYTPMQRDIKHTTSLRYSSTLNKTTSKSNTKDEIPQQHILEPRAKVIFNDAILLSPIGGVYLARFLHLKCIEIEFDENRKYYYILLVLIPLRYIWPKDISTELSLFVYSYFIPTLITDLLTYDYAIGLAVILFIYIIYDIYLSRKVNYSFKDSARKEIFIFYLYHVLDPLWAMIQSLILMYTCNLYIVYILILIGVIWALLLPDKDNVVNACYIILNLNNIIAALYDHRYLAYYISGSSMLFTLYIFYKALKPASKEEYTHTIKNPLLVIQDKV